MNVLIPFHECSFKRAAVTWLVKPNVKGTAIHPKFKRELEPWGGTAGCGRCWGVSHTPSQFYLQGTQTLLMGTVATTHLVWGEKSVSLLQLPNLQPSPARPGLLRISWISCFCWDLLSVLKGGSQLARGYQVFMPSQKIRPSTQLLVWLPSLEEGVPNRQGWIWLGLNLGLSCRQPYHPWCLAVFGTVAQKTCLEVLGSIFQ